jgi:hypothetical protein
MRVFELKHIHDDCIRAMSTKETSDQKAMPTFRVRACFERKSQAMKHIFGIAFVTKGNNTESLETHITAKTPSQLVKTRQS